MAKHHIRGHGRLRQVVYGVMRLFARTRAPTKRYARSPGRQDHTGPTAIGDLDIINAAADDNNVVVHSRVILFVLAIEPRPTPSASIDTRNTGVGSASRYFNVGS